MVGPASGKRWNCRRGPWQELWPHDVVSSHCFIVDPPHREGGQGRIISRETNF